MWKKILAGLLIVVGLILIFSNEINEQVVNYQAKQTNQEALAATPEEIRENTERTLPGPAEEELYDFSKVEPASLEQSMEAYLARLRQTQTSETMPSNTAASGTAASGTAASGNTGNSTSSRTTSTSGQTSAQATGSALSKYSKSYIIGILKIPKINLELGVLKGVLNDNLYIGAGTMRKDQVMGERNYPIAGHHMRWWEVLFNRVPELKAGDLMYITDKENIYTYRVFANTKVHKTETRVIYDSVASEHGTPVLTLVTCFNRDEPEVRVIIHGELIQVEPFTAAAFSALK